MRLFSSRTVLAYTTVVEQESAWTFGQILPVLLLIAPLFSVFGLFLARSTWADNSKRDDHDETIVLGQLNESTASSSSCLQGPESAEDAKKDKETPIKVRCRTATNISSLYEPSSYWIDRDYYQAPWIGGSIVCLCASIITLTTTAAGLLYSFSSDLSPFYSLARFWYSEYGAVFYMVVGIPSATTFCILLGLTLDPWFRTIPKLACQIITIVLSFMIHIPYPCLTFLLQVETELKYKGLVHLMYTMIITLGWFGLHVIIHVISGIWKKHAHNEEDDMKRID